MRRRIVATAGVVVALGVVEAILGAASERVAAASPEVAQLRLPVLVAAVAFCAMGQLAVVVAALAGWGARWALVGMFAAMVALLAVIYQLTAAEGVTPPALVLACWLGAALLIALGLVVATRGPRRQSEASNPAARAGSA